MIAKYEQSVLSGKLQAAVQRYGGLQNLPHWHMESELICAESGCAEVMAENTVYQLTEGRCIFVRGGAVHYIKADAESVLTVMKIKSELIASVAGERAPVCPLLENSYPIAETAERIRREISAGEKYHEAVCTGLAMALVAEIFRGEKTQESGKLGESTAYKDLLSLISERYADMTFDEAAEFMCFSKPYFSKYFCKMSGMTFSEYLNIVRVSAAVKMLSRGNMAIGEAALAAGFGTIRSFNRVFKQLTGCTPRELPKEQIFIESGMSAIEKGFDPTLGVTRVLG